MVCQGIAATFTRPQSRRRSRLIIPSGSTNSKLISVQNEKASLYRLISLETSVNATGWGLFGFNGQVLLKFTNFVIPFAVLIITASLQ